jgi:hypothetical protein
LECTSHRKFSGNGSLSLHFSNNNLNIIGRQISMLYM